MCSCVVTAVLINTESILLLFKQNPQVARYQSIITVLSQLITVITSGVLSEFVAVIPHCVSVALV